MAEIVIAVAGAAAYFRRLAVQHGDHIVVHHALAAHAKIVDIVAQTDVAHHWRLLGADGRAGGLSLDRNV